MSWFSRRLAARLAACLVTLATLLSASGAFAQDGGWYPITGEDGKPVTNYRVPVELESEVEKLPGVVVIGNPKGDVTLAEFYDLNCPFCRKAAADIEAMLKADDELRVVLVPFPVLGVPSIQAGRVELVLAMTATAEKFRAFHNKIYAGRGTVDGTRALAVAKDLGFDQTRILQAADADEITHAMVSHVKLGNALGLQATPAYIVKGIAVLGHPGRKALEEIVASIRKCDKPHCG